MAATPTTTNIEEASSSEPLKYKTWVLKVSIHCKGCKRKVIKVLSSIQGVHNFDVDLKLQRVVVSGSIDVDTLIYKLIKSGRNAELWPELYNPKQGKSGKDKNKEKRDQIQRTPSDGGHGEKERQGSGKVVNPATAEPNDVALGTAKVVQAELSKPSVGTARIIQAENTTSGVPTAKLVNHAGGLTASIPTPTKSVNHAGGLTASIPTPTKSVNHAGGLTASIPTPTKSVNHAGGLTASIPTTTKLVNQAGSLAASIPTTTKLVHQEGATTVRCGGEEVETGGNKAEMGSSGGSSSSQSSSAKSVGKKKKKKGQNGNMSGAEEQSRIEEASSHNAWMGPQKKNSGVTPPPSANNNPPRQLENQYPPTNGNYYVPPAPSVYVMSYNTNHPTPNYTTSYYNSPTPFSSSSHYSYSRYHEPSHTVELELEPPPSYNDPEASYARQQQQQPPPLDSFELFSDENPNGCSVM